METGMKTTPGGRPETSKVPAKWRRHLDRIAELDREYQQADLAADSLRSRLAEERGVKPARIVPSVYPEYAEASERREEARKARAQAMQNAVDAGVSMYRIAKHCGFRSGSAHVANVLKSFNHTRI